MLIPIVPFAEIPRDREADRRAAVEGPWWIAPLAAPRAVDLCDAEVSSADAERLVAIVRERPTHVLDCRDVELACRLLDEGALSVVLRFPVLANLPPDIPGDRIGLLEPDANALPRSLSAGTIWTSDSTSGADDPRARVILCDGASFDSASANFPMVAIRNAHSCSADLEARAFCARIARPGDAPLLTLLCDGLGVAIAWGWSKPDSIQRSMMERHVHMAATPDTSVEPFGGALIAVEMDRGGRALRYRVEGPAIDVSRPNAWAGREGFSALFAKLRERALDAPPGSYTRRLLDSPDMLRGKLLEEAAELAAASSAADVRGEAADVLYFAWVALARAGVSPGEVEAELARRALRMNRRPGDVKPPVAPERLR